jgi:hypothetical protein
MDPETFLIEVYVLVTDVLGPELPPDHPRPGTALTRGEVLTLALFSQFARFRSERDFYRYAETALRGLFPRLPGRPEFNRAVRRAQSALTHLALGVAESLLSEPPAFELLDSTAVPVRNCQRRGHGWLPDRVDIGKSPRLGWYEGFHLLACAAPNGVLTGWGVGPASANDRDLAETLLAVRHTGDPRLPSAGQPASGWYVADAGFAGRERIARWHAAYGAIAVCTPQHGSRAARAWSPEWGRWLAQLRQPIESVVERLLEPFRLEKERPHTWTGFQARLAAKAALHNVCIWLARRQHLPDLSLAALLEW